MNAVAVKRPGCAKETAASDLPFRVFHASVALFLIAVAAAEAALALALVVLLYRYQGTLDANAYRMLKDE